VEACTGRGDDDRVTMKNAADTMNNPDHKFPTEKDRTIYQRILRKEPLLLYRVIANCYYQPALIVTHHVTNQRRYLKPQ